jgi:hypothetical protein
MYQGKILSASVKLSLKLLLNIASCMGQVLEGGWFVVLETLQSFERMLWNPSMAKTVSETSIFMTRIYRVMSMQAKRIPSKPQTLPF